MSRRSVLARQAVLLTIAAVLYIGVITYAMVGDTGPAGWINAAQARVDGSYSRKITGLVLTFAFSLVILPFAIWLYPKDVPPSDPGAPPMTMAFRFVWAFVALVVLDASVWASALGYAMWEARGQGLDAAATYTPLTLAAAPPPRAAEGDHLALRGRLLGDHVVTRTEGNDSRKMALVPIVETGWKEGDPVHLLLSVESDMSYVVNKALHSNEGVLLVRVEGPVPSPALDVFTRMKAPIADDARTLAFVPSEGGRPSAPPAELDWTTIKIWGWIGTVFVVLACFFYTFMPQLVRRAERQAAARAARQAARRR